MKRENLIVVVLVATLLSGCAGFKTIREAEDFLAAEKAKNIKPVTKMYASGYITPMDTIGKQAIALAAAPLALVAAPVAVVGAVIGAHSGLVVATKNSKAEDLWYLTGVKIDYGRMALYHVHKWNEKDEREYLHNALDLALMTVGPPPAPCGIAKKTTGFGDNTGKNRFKRTNTYVTDREARQGIFMTTHLKAFVFYKTVKENVGSEGPTYCTKELADGHFAKLVEYMEKL